MIRGPCTSESTAAPCIEQDWEFFTGIAFRLDLRGVGLMSSDKIRIAPASADCNRLYDGSGEPSVLKGCPEHCTPLSIDNAYQYGSGAGMDDVDIQITTSESVDCDVMNQNC